MLHNNIYSDQLSIELKPQIYDAYPTQKFTGRLCNPAEWYVVIHCHRTDSTDND